MTSDDFRQKIRNLAKLKEKAEFWITLGVIIYLSPYLLNILKRTWELKEGTIYFIGQIIISIDPLLISGIINVILGFYLGLFLLVIIDEKKRTQGILYSALILYLTGNILLGNLFPHVEWGRFLLWFVIGTLIGLISGGAGNLLKGRLEFKRASTYLVYASTSIIILTFIYYVDLIRLKIPFSWINFFEDAAVAIIFIIFFNGFLKYELKSSKVFLIGPPNSGKSTLTLGLYLKALERAGSKPIEPSKQLLNLDKEFKEAIKKDEWNSETREEALYQFTYRSGTYFPKETTISTIDYPGGYLSGIARAMEQDEKKMSSMINLQAATEAKSVDESSVDNTYKRIAERIKESDKIVLVVDGSKRSNSTYLSINDFTEIIKTINKKSKVVDYYIVLTKCDIFKEEFQQRSNKVPDSTTYDEYKDYIMEKFRDIDEIRLLIAESYGAELYPVFYPTKKNKNGSLTVSVDGEGNLLSTFGFDKLLEDLV